MHRRGFFINRLVLATGAAGGGATNADESARQVRTLIATRAIIVARIHAFDGLKKSMMQHQTQVSASVSDAR